MSNNVEKQIGPEVEVSGMERALRALRAVDELNEAFRNVNADEVKYIADNLNDRQKAGLEVALELLEEIK